MNSVFLDSLMILLLVSVIIFCLQLSKRLAHLRKTGTDLAPTLRSLSALISQSTTNIELLKSASHEVNNSLSQMMPKAITLKDDLHFMLEHGEKLFKRLEEICEKSKNAHQQLSLSIEIFEKQRNSALKNSALKNSSDLSSTSDAFLQNHKNLMHSLKSIR